MGVRTWIAVLISVMWAIGYVDAILRGNYTGIGTATPVMLMAAAYLLSQEGKNGKPKGPRP